MVQSPRRNTIVSVEPTVRHSSNPFDPRSRPSSLLLSTSPSSTASSSSSSGPTTPSSFLNFTDLALPPGLWDQDGKTGYLGEPRLSLPSHHKVPAAAEVSYRSDVDFWLDKAGTILLELLRFAKYPQEATDQHYAVFRDVICPALGPRPASNKDGRLTPAFPSFMCDDHTPLEFGIGSNNGETCVRLSFEPISHHHEADRDQGLSLFAAQRCMKQLEDRGLATFATFRKMLEVGVVNHLDDSHVSIKDSSVASQIFLAIDFGRHGEVMIKTYMLPLLRARSTGRSTFEVIRQTFDHLRLRPPALTMIEGYTREVQKRGQSAQAVILSTDAIKDEARARYKLYVRYLTTNFEEILDHLSLDGILDRQGWIEPLRRVWQAVLGLDPTIVGQSNAPFNLDKPTGGCLIYYDFLRDSATPSSKIYLPVRHWAKDDEQVARGLMELADEPNRPVETFNLEDGYDIMISQCYQDEDNAGGPGKGRHTWVTVARKANGKFELSAYLNPQIFDNSA